MPPNRQRRQMNSKSDQATSTTGAWPTDPGAAACHLIVPPAPTMQDIHDAFAADAVVEPKPSAALAGNNTQDGDAPVREEADYGEQIGVATVVVGAETLCEEIQGEPSAGSSCCEPKTNAALHTETQQTYSSEPVQQRDAVAVLSSHVPFMGFVDANGIVHTDSVEGSSKNDRERVNNRNNNRNPALLSTKMSSLSSSNNEEEKTEIPTSSAEDILQESLTFERSHPAMRFSSTSLGHLHYSSSSSRHLYPSLEDVDCHQQLEQTQRESTDSVRTTVSEVIASTMSASVLMEAASMEASIVPEPPGVDPVAFAAPFEINENNDVNNNNDDGEVKMGVVGAEPVAPTFAVAAVDDGLVSSAEATVLETSQTPEEALLRKLEAEDAELVALKRSAYACSGAASSLPVSADQQATVVAITEHEVHPSDISNNAVTAELIGEDYNNVASVPTTASTASAASNDCATQSTYESTTAGVHATTGAVLAVEDPGYAVVESEATIIDQEASWYPSQTEEAVVLNDDTLIPDSERKLPAVKSHPIDDHGGIAAGAAVAVAVAQGETEVGRLPEDVYLHSAIHTHAFADEEAEVVGITEEFHPDEVSGNEAQAELVAEDFSSAVASPQCAAAFEATASLSEQLEEVQAATVLGYEDVDEVNDENGITRAHSLGSPTPDRISPASRASSAPSAVGTPVSFDDAVGTPVAQEAVAALETVLEEDWMRTPSFRGFSSEDVLVMKPPMDGGEEQPQAVAVASLDAYATSSSPLQPAVAVAALNAFASAPVLEFDPTDCRLVNQQPQSAIGEADETSTTAEPAMPPPRSFNCSGGNSEGGSVNSAASKSVGFQKIQSSFAKGMELLFGDAKAGQGRSSELDDGGTAAQSVVPRELLPWSVIHSEATNMWIATVNTNQKALDSKNVVEASKSLRAFSVVAEKQATCLAKAWSPPRTHAFSKKPACHICSSKFAVFRRACHCRNCGICVCTACVVNWPAKMVPETYNIKKESFVNICKGCDWLCTSFRVSLLEGNRDKAIALHATGNINLVTPFANVKGELFYPVHCAALGGNLELLKWLVDDNCCPIKSVRVSGRCRDAANSFTEISTSKGRSLLGIALENCNVGIVRYLVVQKGIQLAGEKDITMDTLCRNLDLVLRFLPEDAVGHPGVNVNAALTDAQLNVECEEHAPVKERNNQSNTLRALDETASDDSVNDACIICFDATIDCVATPCGHQICCIKCSKNIIKCPVCAVDCTFMRVFRP